MTPLDRKLLRDVRRLSLTMTAAAAVMACGLAIFVMAAGMSTSLESARDRYYLDARMADLAVSLVRAPEALADSLLDIPGVLAVEIRSTDIAQATLEGVQDPLSVRMVSLPEDRRPRVNDLVLRRGRWPDPSRRLEGLINEAFAVEHRVSLGQTLTVILRGRRYPIEIVGIANSPEFVFAVAPGALLPEPRRFGVVWVGRDILVHALDLQGAFNELLLRHAGEANVSRIVAEIDTRLGPFGSRGVYGRDRMLSARYLSDELSQLDTLARTLPPIFLAVAAFLLNTMLSRLVSAERAHIGLLKAFGYRNRAIGSHYLRLALLCAVSALVGGVALGIAMGRNVAAIYQRVYHLPSLSFEVDPLVLTIAGLVALAAAFVGATSAVRRAAQLAPALALAPPSPTRFRAMPTLIERWIASLGARLRMLVRRLLRFPRRSFTTVGGFALALALLIVAEHFPLTIEQVIRQQFGMVQRMDATLALSTHTPSAVLQSALRLPGVAYAEAGRSAEVIFSAGPRRVRESLIGLPQAAKLNRLVDMTTRVVEPDVGGLTLAAGLATRLHVEVGDWVRVEATDGKRATFEAPVIEIIRTSIGASAYAEIDSLGRWLRETGRVDTVHVVLDDDARSAFLSRVRTLSRVAGVTFTDQAEQSLRRLFAQGSGFISSLFRFFSMIMAVGIAVSTVRVTLGEQARDLATLRVLGFDRRETSWILLGELVSLLVISLPVGVAAGVTLSQILMRQFETELFSFPFVLDPRAYARSILIVVTAVAIAALWLRREVDRLDLVAVLKTHE